MRGKLKTYLILGAITVFTILIIKRKKGKSKKLVKKIKLKTQKNK